MKLDFNDSDLNAFIGKLRTFDKRMERAGLRKVVSAGVTPLMKHIRRLIPRGAGKSPDGSTRMHLRQTLVRKIKRYTNGNYVGVFGHKYPMTPHAHLVHDGVAPHDIVAGIRGADRRRKRAGKSTGKKVLSNKNSAGGNKFFGTKVKHKGFAGQKYIPMAIERGRFESIQAMATKAREVIAKAAASK